MTVIVTNKKPPCFQGGFVVDASPLWEQLSHKSTLACSYDCTLSMIEVKGDGVLFIVPHCLEVVIWLKFIILIDPDKQ